MEAQRSVQLMGMVAMTVFMLTGTAMVMGMVMVMRMLGCSYLECHFSEHRRFPASRICGN